MRTDSWGSSRCAKAETMITFDHVTKTYDDGKTIAVSELCMQVTRGETLVLLGTSGSGKTTTMKMVNRLTDPTAGRISVDGRDIMETDPIELRRGIGYAIQHIGLFPHMTVGDNIGVVPRLLGWQKSRIDDRTDELLSLVGLGPTLFRDRYPSQLSGGQRQRVGVARALAADPPVVLMDEPFGALDPITREQLQNEFLELETQIAKTVLFVTHDVFEAVRMGDRIALLDHGRLQQLATPANLVERPANDFVDEFLGQHRFQLSLLTQTIDELMSCLTVPAVQPTTPPAKVLSARTSLVGALDFFKTNRCDAAPVYSGGKCVGDISRDDVLEKVYGLLRNAPGEESS